jgi:hypothetical protein
MGEADEESEEETGEDLGVRVDVEQEATLEMPPVESSARV